MSELSQYISVYQYFINRSVNDLLLVKCSRHIENQNSSQVEQKMLLFPE